MVDPSLVVIFTHSVQVWVNFVVYYRGFKLVVAKCDQIFHLATRFFSPGALVTNEQINGEIILVLFEPSSSIRMMLNRALINMHSKECNSLHLPLYLFSWKGWLMHHCVQNLCYFSYVSHLVFQDCSTGCLKKNETQI